MNGFRFYDLYVALFFVSAVICVVNYEFELIGHNLVTTVTLRNENRSSGYWLKIFAGFCVAQRGVVEMCNKVVV